MQYRIKDIVNKPIVAEVYIRKSKLYKFHKFMQQFLKNCTNNI